MIVYTVNIPLKKEFDNERLKQLVRKYASDFTNNIELCDGKNVIFAGRLDEKEWTSDFILVLSQEKKLLTVNLNAVVDREPIDIIKHIPKFVAKLFCDKDFPIEPGYLTSLGEPIGFDTSDILQNKVIETMCGRGQGALPMIYISKLQNKSDDRDYAVDPAHLAQTCAALACVVTEDSKRTSYKLKAKTKGRNAFNGYIRVYYPYIEKYHEILPLFDDNDKKTETNVFDILRRWWLDKTSENEYTWNRLQILREIQIAKEEKGETEALIAAFEKESQDKDNEIERLKGELRSEKDARYIVENENTNLLELLHNKEKKTNRICLLEKPDFEEWYRGEFSAVIRSILEKENNNQTLKGSRKDEILTAIINQNPISREAQDEKSKFDKIKVDIKKADNEEKQIKILEQFGLAVTSENKHYKLRYKSPYSMTLAKSAGDKRATENTIHDFLNKINPYQ
ncbi:MAG: hypothetical protein LBP26_06710 [Clostridiales bacterium]|jgi:hypothetical protein|nr:hypothetical protein [Clostridiales bacterium]